MRFGRRCRRSSSSSPRVPDIIPVTKSFESLAELFISEGLVTREQVQECLRELKRRGPEVNHPSLLVEKGLVSEEVAARTLARLPELDGQEESILGPGTDVGKYVLGTRLGRGGMGEVWQGRDKDLERDVAIKFVTGSDPEARKRFLREAQVVAGLKHPHIAPIYEIGTYQGVPFLLMRLVEGRTIDQAGLQLKQVLAAIEDVARALDDAHSSNIIHRDIKPGNIMVEVDKAYLMDFGLARMTQVDSSISETGMIMGTPQFMSPEQARGQTRTIGPGSDIYSLGSTLYALTTGEAPFTGEDVMEVLRKVADEEPPRPSTIREGLLRDVETIILKCMEKESARRYRSSLELAEDLERYLKGDAIAARPAGAGYRIRKRLAKHRWIAVSTAVAVLLAVGFGLYVFFSNRVLRDRQEQYLALARDAEAAGQLQVALSSYEWAAGLAPLDAETQNRRKALSLKVAMEKERLRDEAERQAALTEANKVYSEASRNLHLLSLRSYRSDWRLTSEELSSYKALVTRVHAQMRKTGPAAEAWWITGRVQQVSSDPEGAHEAFARALSINPNHTPSILYKARLLIEQAVWQRFQERARDDSEVVQGLIDEARVLLKTGLKLGGGGAG